MLVTAMDILQGSLQLVDIASTGSVSADDILRLTASAESATRHPLAESIAHAAKHRGLEVPSSSNASTEPGAGVSASVNGKKVPILYRTADTSW